MLPASVPMSGTPTKADKSLRSLFCGAANHLTQLYMSSLKLEKGATKKGYCRAVEDLIKFLQLQQQYGRTISIESLVDHLKTKKREILQREDNDFGEDEDEHEEGDETPVLGVPLGENKPPAAAPTPFGSTTRSLASQFEGLSASGGGTFGSSSDHHMPRMGSATIAAAPAPVHFGFATAPAASSTPLLQHAPQHSNAGTTSASSATTTSAQFPSSTFRDAVSVPFPLSSSSSASSAINNSNNPFAPLEHGNGMGRKRQYFEFFFDAPPNLTVPSGGALPANGGGFQFTPSSHSTSTSISPAAAPSSSSLVGSSSAGGGAGESDGAMDFSCYEHQVKRYRREEEQQQHQQHNPPPHRTSANTS